MSLLFDASARAADLSEKRRKKEKGSWWKDVLKQTVVTGVATPIAETISEGISGAMNMGATNAARVFSASEEVTNLKSEAIKKRELADVILTAEKSRMEAGESVEDFHTNRAVESLLKRQKDFVNTQYVTTTSTDSEGKVTESIDLPVQSKQIDDDVFRAQIIGTDGFNKRIKKVSKNWANVVKEAQDILDLEEYEANISRGYTGGVGFADRTLRRLSALLSGQSLQEKQDASIKGMQKSQWAKDIGELDLAFENYEKNRDYSGVVKAWKSAITVKKLMVSVDPQYQDKVKITESYKVVNKQLVKVIASEYTTNLGRRVTKKVEVEDNTIFDDDGKINQSGLVSTLPNLYSISNQVFSERGTRAYLTAANELLKGLNEKNGTNFNIVSLAKTGNMESYNAVANLYAKMAQDYGNYDIFEEQQIKAHVGAAQQLSQSAEGLRTVSLVSGILPEDAQRIMDEKYPGRSFSSLTPAEIEAHVELKTHETDLERAKITLAQLVKSISTVAENTSLVNGGFIRFDSDYNKYVPVPPYTEKDVERERQRWRVGK